MTGTAAELSPPSQGNRRDRPEAAAFLAAINERRPASAAISGTCWIGRNIAEIEVAAVRVLRGVIAGGVFLDAIPGPKKGPPSPGVWTGEGGP